MAVPAATPVTIPLPSTVATLVLPLLHVPVPPALNKVVVPPAHNVEVPVMALGAPFTANVATAGHPDIT